MLVRKGQGDYPRVYRPWSPYELYGQAEAKHLMINSLMNRSVNHSYLFHGPSGTGKTTCARIIGMGMLCEHGLTHTPCGVCQQCSQIAQVANLDFLEIDSAQLSVPHSWRKLQEKMASAPFSARGKFFVFDECHRLSKKVQNRLLKQVEDAPEHVYSIFCSTHPSKLIEPLQNRCMSVEFELVGRAETKRLLVDVCDWEGLSFPNGNLATIIEKAGGKPRNALFELQKAVEVGALESNGSARIFTLRYLREGGKAMVVSLADPFSPDSFRESLKNDPDVIVGIFNLSELQAANAIILSLAGESLQVNTPFTKIPEELLALIKECKPDILRILKGKGEETESDSDSPELSPPPAPSKPSASNKTASPPMKMVAPEIVSASRRTDIPAYHSDWFFNRLAQGYLIYKLPYGGKLVRVSFENTRMIVFWTKNPAPMLERLDELDQCGIGYYFQFTLNDYEDEGLEPGLSSLENRIETFRQLSGRIGKERVIWRFDPLIRTDTITPEILIERVERIAGQLSGHTEKLVFSFFRSGVHKKADRKLAKASIQIRDFTADEVSFVAQELGRIGKEHNLTVAACAEESDLSQYGIEQNKCIDDGLMKRVFGHDKVLMDHLSLPENLSAPGQRKNCGCIASEDIGQYSTCKHNCLYCYANTSDKVVEKNFARIDPAGEFLIPPSEKKINRVQDWSSKTVNCCNGCSNGCLYCYARGEAVLRFGRLTDEEWNLGAVREKDVNRNYPKFDQTVMFPSTHDITWGNFDACHTVLCKLLKAGNRVLVVSKPRPKLIGILCDDFEPYKDQIAFRFTIGASNDDILSFWEPGATNYADRKEALMHAHAMGYRTSVSMEPMLDSDNVSVLVEELRPFVNWRIWLGTMNHAWYIKKYQDPAIDAALARIEEGQTVERLQSIYDRYKDDPLIRFKRDFLKKLGLPHSGKSEGWPED